MKSAVFVILSIFSIPSCARYGSISNPIILQPEERHDVFEDLLRRKAPRIDVEVIAALGENYIEFYKNHEGLKGPEKRKAVIHSLSISGVSKDSICGDTVYRVVGVAQAKKILAKTWPKTDFSPTSELGLLFKRYPRASIAMMECDKQRIFFFDDADHLVAIYPDRGGGC